MAGVMEIGSGLSIRISARPGLLFSVGGRRSLRVGGGSRLASPCRDLLVRSARAKIDVADGPAIMEKRNSYGRQSSEYKTGEAKVSSDTQRKTKIVCTIGPSTNTREMIWKLAEAGMNVARLNMSHGDHASHQKVIDLVKEYNAQTKDNVIAIMLDTKGPEVRSGDVAQPIMLEEGQVFNFTIKRGVSSEDTVSVNYDDFINDVAVGDIILVDGGMMSLDVRSKSADTVKCEVIDGGELKSRRHLNVRGKSATLPSVTEKDWEDIKFGVDNKLISTLYHL
ncbi:pyruvate kinase isozyme G, chloroplastic-like [Iris pallida]|uniref:pyruvate kinase n=1 Tax=Iris pallida TaxID=29817 RepID=A0AAX6DZT4_IRIPA|nr:pyruvate kinase isozyme G, chloroplastic-like [Iris pallida]